MWWTPLRYWTQFFLDAYSKFTDFLTFYSNMCFIVTGLCTRVMIFIQQGATADYGPMNGETITWLCDCPPNLATDAGQDHSASIHDI